MQTAILERAASPIPGESGLSCDDLANRIFVSVRKGDDYYTTAGTLLLEAKERLPEFGLTFSAFIVGKCHLRTSRAYELIAIAEGRTTAAEVQEKGRERAARHAAKNKAARSSVSNGQSASPDPLSEQRNIVTLAMRDMNLEDLTRLAKYASDLIAKESSDRTDERNKLTAQTKPLTRKLTPASLAARRKSMADSKAYTDYTKQFGGFAIFAFSDENMRRVTSSLESGIDDFADVKREQAEYTREEAHRRNTLNAPLMAPITPEKEQAYTRLIKTRELYEGACGLSWPEYFNYRVEHSGCSPLSQDDLEYAGMWTACALNPQTASGTIH